MKEIGIKGLQQYMQQAFDRMQKSEKLFVSSFSGREVWDAYLAGLAPDPIFRDPNSSEHNCNLCNNFIRRYGNIVAVDEFGGGGYILCGVLYPKVMNIRKWRIW